MKEWEKKGGQLEVSAVKGSQKIPLIGARRARNGPGGGYGCPASGHPSECVPARKLSYRCATIAAMAVRKKRSISLPPELDAEIAAAAEQAGVTYSSWLAATARKEFTIRAGLTAVTQFEDEHGAFSPEELADADRWAAEAIGRASAAGQRRRSA
jgi:hypothetical protein